MPFFSTLVKLELIGQVLSFKCNNVKEIQTEYHSPYIKGKLFFICAFSVFLSWVHVQCFGVCLSYIGAEELVAEDVVW